MLQVVLNILSSKFIINKLTINGSNREDGINIIKSKGKINDLEIKMSSLMG